MQECPSDQYFQDILDFPDKVMFIVYFRVGLYHGFVDLTMRG